MKRYRIWAAAMLLATVPDCAVEDSDVDTSFIVGGRAESGYPSVGYYSEFWYNSFWDWRCGATLALSSDIAITAAHCVDYTRPRAIGFGAIDSGPLHTARALVHPRFATTDTHDIAVVVLDQPVTGVDPAQLAPPVNGACNYRQVGYGRNVAGPPDVPDGYDGQRKSAQICIQDVGRDFVKVKSPDAALCYGDSGSPLMVEGSNLMVAIDSKGYITGDCYAGKRQNLEWPTYADRDWLYRTVFAGHLVKHLYRHYLHREPNEADWLFHVKPLVNSGRLPSDARAVFVDSPETKIQIPVRDFVSGLYVRYLGRSADSAGLAAWVAALDSGMKRSRVRDSFLNSAEAKLKVSNGSFAHNLFRHILGREPSSSELAARQRQLDGGELRSRVVTEFLDSAEFARRDLPGVQAATTLARIFDYSGL